MLAAVCFAMAGHGNRSGREVDSGPDQRFQARREDRLAGQQRHHGWHIPLCLPAGVF